MRLIDADRLETHEQLKPFGNGNYEYVEVVYKDDIDDAPTIEPEQRKGEWIPVSERLPEEDGEYLCDYNGRVHIGQMINKHFRHYGEIADHLITAWMPLPESYRGE